MVIDNRPLAILLAVLLPAVCLGIGTGCGGGQLPDLGACTKAGETDCQGAWKVMCVKGDGPAEWEYVVECSQGCLDGRCNPAIDGEDECERAGVRTCSGNVVQLCAMGDGFLTLIDVTECDVGCAAGACTDCQRQCDGRECGTDGCGGTCGNCPTGQDCNDGQCVGCEPDCAGKDCGSDGCGGTCGTCAAGKCSGLSFTTSATCQAGKCVTGSATVDCDDDDTCTIDSCDANDGCVNTRIPGWVCKGTTAACTDFGYLEGQATCLASCLDYDYSDCRGTLCGNGIVDPGELCDPARQLKSDVEPACVESGAGILGYVICEKDCKSYKEVVCQPESDTCGNGCKDPGEICDGGVRDCDQLGYSSGVAICKTDCLGWDLSTCCGKTAQKCGNGKVEGDEVCDGGSTSCGSALFVSDAAPCADDCKGYDTLECVGPVCGNGIIEAWEACDPPGTVTCQSLGDEGGGNAVCSGDCRTVDAAACDATAMKCGNKIVDDGEGCDDSFLQKPGISLHEAATYGRRCSDFGYLVTDRLSCLADCSGWDLSPCGCTETEYEHACDGKECGDGACGAECGYCQGELQSCRAGKCVCESECDFDGETQCPYAFANSIQVCAKDIFGCLKWTDGDNCNAMAPVCIDGECGCEDGYQTEQGCGNNGQMLWTCDNGTMKTDGICKGEHGECNKGDSKCVGGIHYECDWEDAVWTVYQNCSQRVCYGWEQCQYSGPCDETGFRHREYCLGPACEAVGTSGISERCAMDFDPVEGEACNRNTDGDYCYGGEEGTCQNGECVMPCDGKFTCGGGECVPLTAVCDDDFDCPDGSDQMGCPACCGSAVLCPDGRCAMQPWACAGQDFQCENGLTVSGCDLCDGTEDCPDGEDESGSDVCLDY